MFKIPSFTYCLLLSLIVPIFLLGKQIKNKDIVYKLSFILFTMEIFKQTYLIINNIWSIWYLPFQLCSMPMYLFLFKSNKAYLKFIKTYSLLGAIAAIIYPMDMIAHGPILCIHSYLFHYIIILMAAIIIFNKFDEGTFLEATKLFLFMCLIATLINLSLNNIGEINMFYINFLLKPYQPIINKIANTYLANTIYILAIILISYLLEHFI